MIFKTGLIVFMVFIQTSMGIKSMEEFFELDMSDLSVFTWDHAVNSENSLSAALANDKHMIECDVILSDGQAVMAHSRGDPIDYTLEEYLDIVIKAVNSGIKKGLKIDFKDTIAFNMALDVMHQKVYEINLPLWINGDIFRGPGGALSFPVRLDKFDEYSQYFTNATLSFGWKTGDIPLKESYDDYVEPMLEFIETTYPSVGEEFHITFAARAMYLDEMSEQKILELIGKTNTITVWSSGGDTQRVNVTSLKKVLDSHKDRIYVDIPGDLQELLNQEGQEESRMD